MGKPKTAIIAITSFKKEKQNLEFASDSFISVAILLYSQAISCARPLSKLNGK